MLYAENLTPGYTRQSGPESMQKGLNLKVLPGRLTAVIGPNGSGKSTLLRTLCGIQEPLAGRVFFDNKPVSAYSLSERSTLLAMVLTDRITDSFLTVEELVGFGRYPHLNWLSRMGKADLEVIEKAISSCGLQLIRKSTLERISDGERQRAMIARAIAQDTPVIILDEPTAHLDLKSRVDILSLLKNLAHQTEKAVVVATHELELALNLADQIWLLPDKNSLLAGIPEELVLNGALEQAFNSDLLQFDPSVGSFCLKPVKGKKIKVSGSGLNAFWTRRALARTGFEVAGQEGDEEVIVAGSHWEYRGQVFNSLSDLVAALERTIREPV